MIAAVVLAAGQSQRMGAPKLILPWGKTTVIGRVVSIIKEAGLDEILVVTGQASGEVAAALRNMAVRLVFNPDYSSGEMLSSCQLGLKQLRKEAEAALIVLGDQPQAQVEVVRTVLNVYRKEKAALVVPSYHLHRGHPWLVHRSLWPDIFDLHAPATLRDFLNRHQDQISYVPVETDSILKDLDTPDEYQREKPKK